MDKQLFDTDIAMELGVIPAILLDSIRRWIEYNENNGKHFYDGETWTYNSVKAWSQGFPYLTQKQIRTAIDSLKEQGYIMVGNYNKAPMDRTLWYALTEKSRFILYGERKRPFALQGTSICPPGQMSFAPQGKPIPSNITSIKTHIFKPPTLEEVTEYAKSRNSSVDPRFFFEFFDSADWVDSQGKKVKNWKQKFITWERSGYRNRKATPEPVNNNPKLQHEDYDFERSIQEGNNFLDEILGDK